MSFTPLGRPGHAVRLRRRVLAAAALAGLILLALPVPPAHAQPRPAASGEVLAIEQSSYVTEQQNFTVSMQVTDPANISLAYFTFCQLTNSLCYAPVRMTLQNTNWFVGTTKPMSSYRGMVVGIAAGYNITIDHTNNVNTSLPAMPNAFGNLTVATTNVGWYMFQMTVGPQLFGLRGAVHDGATGSAVSGATVTLTALASATINGSGAYPAATNETTTNASGGFAFTCLVNGSYTLTVTAAGLPTSNETVQISGNDAVHNVALITSSSGQPVQGGSAGLFGGLSATLIAVIVVVALAALAGGLLLMKRRRGPPTQGKAPAGGDAPPQG